MDGYPYDLTTPEFFFSLLGRIFALSNVFWWVNLDTLAIGSRIYPPTWFAFFHNSTKSTWRAIRMGLWTFRNWDGKFFEFDVYLLWLLDFFPCMFVQWRWEDGVWSASVAAETGHQTTRQRDELPHLKCTCFSIPISSASMVHTARWVVATGHQTDWITPGRISNQTKKSLCLQLNQDFSGGISRHMGHFKPDDVISRLRKMALN